MRIAATTIFFGLFLGSTSGHANDADLIAYGEYLSSQCVTCHQLSGIDNGIPSIVGWDTSSFYRVMVSYRLKERENKVMRTIAASLSDEEIKALAVYFSAIKPKKTRAK